MISLFRPCYRPASFSLLGEIARGRYSTVLAKCVTLRRKGQLYLFWKPPHRRGSLQQLCGALAERQLLITFFLELRQRWGIWEGGITFVRKPGDSAFHVSLSQQPPVERQLT